VVRLAVQTLIEAPAELCFDLARDMNLHAETMSSSAERIVDCPPGGLLELGDQVTFEAKHLGIRQRLTSKIVEYDRPNTFVDEMVAGPFKSLRHEHHFNPVDDQTSMIDIVQIQASLGPLGWIAERLILDWYMYRLVERRGIELKRIAEARANVTPLSTGSP